MEFRSKAGLRGHEASQAHKSRLEPGPACSKHVPMALESFYKMMDFNDEDYESWARPLAAAFKYSDELAGGDDEKGEDASSSSSSSADTGESEDGSSVCSD